MIIKLVIFDLAGTTVKDFDFVPDALVKAFLMEGIEIPLAAAKAVMGIPKPVAIEQLLSQIYSVEEIDSESIQAIHQNFLNEIIHFYKTSPKVKETEGVTDTFRELKRRNIKIGINTGFDRKTTEILLSRLSWIEEGLIDAIVTSDEVVKGRPYPDMIFKIMAITNVKDPTAVVKVGDTKSDLLEGKAAGCGMTIGVTTGAYSEAELKLFPHSYLIERIPQVLDCLQMQANELVEKNS